MLAAQTNSTAFIAAKLTAKTIITWIFFVFACFHFIYSGRKFSQIHSDTNSGFNFIFQTTYIQ